MDAEPTPGRTDFNQVAGAMHAQVLLYGLIDPTTGLHRSSELMEAIYQRASPDSTLVHIDMHNLRQGTEAIGRDLADRFIAVCMKVIHSELKKYHPSVCFGLRQHGDEMGLLADGIAKEDAEKGLEAAKAQIDALTQKCGLHLLAHRKEGRLPGFGFDYISTSINRDLSAAQLLDSLAGALQGQKKGYEGTDATLKQPADFKEADGRLPVEAAIAAIEKELEGVEAPLTVLHRILDDIGIIHSQIMDDRMRKEVALFNAPSHGMLLRLDVRGLSVLNSGGC